MGTTGSFLVCMRKLGGVVDLTCNSFDKKVTSAVSSGLPSNPFLDPESVIPFLH